MMFIMWVMMVIGIGFWASKLNRNVFGYVVLAFFLSPLVAAIVLLIAGQKKDQNIISSPQNPTINVTINNPGSGQPETIVVPVNDTVQEVTTQPSQKTVEKPKTVPNKNKNNKNKNKKPQYKSSSSTQTRKDDTDVVDYTPNVHSNTVVETPRTHVTSVGGHSGHSVSHRSHDDSSSYHHSYSHGSDHSSSYDSGSSYSGGSSD